MHICMPVGRTLDAANRNTGPPCRALRGFGTGAASNEPAVLALSEPVLGRYWVGAVNVARHGSHPALTIPLTVVLRLFEPCIL